MRAVIPVDTFADVIVEGSDPAFMGFDHECSLLRSGFDSRPPAMHEGLKFVVGHLVQLGY